MNLALQWTAWPAAALVLGLVAGMTLHSAPSPSVNATETDIDWSLPERSGSEAVAQAAGHLIERQPWGLQEEADADAAGASSQDDEQAQPQDGAVAEVIAGWRFVGSASSGAGRYGVFRSDSGEHRRLSPGDRLTDDLALIELASDSAVLSSPAADDPKKSGPIRLRLFRETRFEIASPPDQDDDDERDNDNDDNPSQSNRDPER